MKKTFKIHIRGYIFNIEEDAYDLLDNWLQKVAKQYENEEGGDEIVNDIETGAADIFNKEIDIETGVITIKTVNKVIQIMGNPEEFESGEFSSSDKTFEQNSVHYDAKTNKRFYRDQDQKILGGIASGISHYFGLDVTLIRILFIAGSFIGGIGVLLYLMLWAFIPAAETSSQKLEMKGEPVNISNIEKIIKTEFDNIKENFKNHADSAGIKKIKETIKNIAEIIVNTITIIFKGISGIIGFVFIFTGIISLIVLFNFIFYHSSSGLTFYGFETLQFYKFFNLIPLPFSTLTTAIGFFLLMAVPLSALIYLGLRVIFRFNEQYGKVFKITSIGLWIIAWIISGWTALHFLNQFNSEYTQTKTYNIEPAKSDILYLKLNQSYHGNNISDSNIETGNYKIKEAGNVYQLFGKPELNIIKGNQPEIKLKMMYSATGNSEKDAALKIAQINYFWNQQSDTLIYAPYFSINGINKIFRRDLLMTLEIPEGKSINIDSSLTQILNQVENSADLIQSELMNKTLVMSKNGLTIKYDFPDTVAQ